MTNKDFTLTFELNNGSSISLVCFANPEGYEVYLGGRLIRVKATKKWIMDFRKVLKK